MKTATFSQFRNNAKKYIDSVEKGEIIEIYRHGKPVAIVSPVVREDPRDLSRWKTAHPIKIPGVSASRIVVDQRKGGKY